MDDIKNWLHALVVGILDDTSALEILTKEDEMGVLYTITGIAPDERGKIIGRQGKTAEALRTLLRSVGMSKNVRAALRIDIPDFSQPKEGEV